MRYSFVQRESFKFHSSFIKYLSKQTCGLKGKNPYYHLIYVCINSELCGL